MMFQYNSYLVIIFIICLIINLSSENISDLQRRGRKRIMRSNFGHKMDEGEWPHHILIFRVYDRWRNLYRAFCAGTLIKEQKVLTSTNCFLTNRKNRRVNLNHVKTVGGILQTIAKYTEDHPIQQWRGVVKLYSQRLYRYPAFNLGVLILDGPFELNRYIKTIPFASVIQDFDGFCTGTAVKATKAWSRIKYVYTEEVLMIRRAECERTLCRSCRLFLCTTFHNQKLGFSETEGGGLVCYETGDPEETDLTQGVLVGVTSVVHIGLPNLNMRIDKFHKWIEAGTSKVCINNFLMKICLCLYGIKFFISYLDFVY